MTKAELEAEVKQLVEVLAAFNIFESFVGAEHVVRHDGVPTATQWGSAVKFGERVWIKPR